MRLEPFVIGVDVGGTNMTGGLAAADGTLVAKVRRTTDRSGGMTAGLAAIVEILSELMAHAAREAAPIGRLGIGFGGPVDHDRGVVLRSHHVAGWENAPLRDELQRRFQIPVAVDNDANAGTLGEWRFGAGRDCEDLLYVNVGTGIGGGIVAGGRLVRGAGNLAGEIGHAIVLRDGPLCTCGRRGCLEACASGEALGRRASEALGRPVSGREVISLAGTGNEAARRVLDAVVEDLAYGIGTAVALLNPRLVIVGGGLSEAPEAMFLAPLRHAVSRYCLGDAARNLRVEAAQLRYDAGVVGAVALALQG